MMGGVVLQSRIRVIQDLWGRRFFSPLTPVAVYEPANLQEGGDIWGCGTLVPIRPHTDLMRFHRSETRREQESD